MPDGGGYVGKVLRVNLSKGSHQVERVGLINFC